MAGQWWGLFAALAALATAAFGVNSYKSTKYVQPAIDSIKNIIVTRVVHIQLCKYALRTDAHNTHRQLIYIDSTVVRPGYSVDHLLLDLSRHVRLSLNCVASNVSVDIQTGKGG